KLGWALDRLTQEDPSLASRVDNQSGQRVLAGMGELHLEVVMERLRREFGVEVNAGRPQVAFRETVSQEAQAEGRFERASAEGELFARVELAIRPGHTGSGMRFSTLVDAEVPDAVVASIRRGVEEAALDGGQAGYELTDVVVSLVGGSFGDARSTELAYKVAASRALTDAARDARPVLLEPVMLTEVTTPDEFTGEVIGDLSARRGNILGMDARGIARVVSAEVPLASMFGYATELRSRTKGRATFSMKFGFYSPMPSHVAEGVLSKVQGRL
ncbi:MAG: elongation factor G, partial [Myxococcota bacterium]